MLFGLDYITGPPIAALETAGVTFVCRYLSKVNDLTKVKLLTPAEAKALGAAGISIVSNYEWYANRAAEGAASGAADAQIARDQHAACGGPADRPIYFSVDFSAAGPDVADYFRGVASVIGLARTGAYGSYRVIKYLFDNKLITWGWQTYAWSGGAWEPRRHIEQYSNSMTLGGASVDFNHSMVADFGQWIPGGGTTTSTIELANFPMISQRDSDKNADFDCVPASIAACMQWLTGTHYTASEIKDAVYGPSYVGGTAAKAYIGYCADRGVKLAPVDGNGPALVTALRHSLAAQHPALITEPDPYMPTSSGFSHVCAAYKCDATSITVMDPWIDRPVTKSDAEWASELEFNQIWTLEKHMPIPTNWKNTATTLTAPNGVSVVLGFRDHILNAASWDAANQPQEAEYHADQVLLHNAAVGAGQRQVFRDGFLWYTSAKGVVEEPFTGLELDAAYKLIAVQQAQIAALKAQQNTTLVDTSAAEAAITAIADGVAPLIAKALVEVKKL